MLVVAGSGPVPKDAVIAILGASAALAGLVLVFLGLLLPAFREAWAAGARSTDTPEQWSKVMDGLRWAVRVALLALPLSFASVGLSLAWLALPGGPALYHANIWLFVAELIAVFVLAVVAIIALLRFGVPKTPEWMRDLFRRQRAGPPA